MKSSVERKNFIWNFIGLTFNSFNFFFFLIIVNRINGIKEAGVFTYAFAVACLLWVVSMYYNRVYQVSNKNIKEIDYIRFRSLSCLVMLIFSIFIALLSISSIYKFLVIILLCLFRNIEAFADSFYGIIHKNNRLDYVGKSLFLKALIGVLAFLGIDYLTKNVILSILGLILVNVIGTFIDYKTSKPYIKEVTKFDKKVVQKIIKESFPIFIFSFLGIFLANCQKYVMGFTTPEEMQTIFGILIMPATFMSLCGQYLINPFLTKLTNNYDKKEYKSFNEIIRKILFVLMIVGLIAAIGIYFVGEQILEIIYDIELNYYSLSLMIIIISATFYSLSAVLSSALTIMKKNKIQLYIYLIASVISTIISYVLINMNGINGAVTAYSLTILIHFIMYYVVYKLELKKKSEVL